VESYVMGKLNGKVLTEIKKYYKDEDTLLVGRMSKMQALSTTDIGLRYEFARNAHAAITPVSKLPQCYTPLELLLCFQNAIETASTFHQVDNVAVISADDTLPILVYAIIHARPLHLYSYLMYIENFIFANISASPLGYHLVNLQAAIHFIRYGQMGKGSGDIGEEDYTYTNHNFKLQNRDLDQTDEAGRNSFQLQRSISVDSSLVASQAVTLPKPTRIQSTSYSALPLHTSTVANRRNSVPRKLNEPPQPPGSYQKPPAVIDLGKEEKKSGLGDFLTMLKQSDDVSRRQFNSIWSS